MVCTSRRFLLIIIPPISLLAIYCMWSGFRESGTKLEVTRIAPLGDEGREVQCSSFEQVNFQYRIVNRSQRSLNGLKLGMSCACQITEELPAEMAPGASATIGFQMRAPYAGQLDRLVPVTAEGSNEPLVVLRPLLRVKSEPPAVIQAHGDHNLLFIQGENAHCEFAFETIERREDKPWVTGIELRPADKVEINAPRIDEVMEQDPVLVRRRYRYPLSNKMRDVGKHSITASLLTREGGPPTDRSFVLQVSVVDSVAIVPNPLVIQHTPGTPVRPLRVSVINRTKNLGEVTSIRYDENLVQVRRNESSGNSVQTFDIVPLELLQDEFDIPVVFDVGHGESRELLVRIQRSHVPQN